MQCEMNLIGTTRPLLSPNSCGSSCSSDCSTLRLLDKEAKTTLQLLPPEENPLYVQQGDYMNLKIASISKIVLLVLILITLSAPLAFSQESENESQAVPANQLPLFDGVPTVRTDIHHDVSLPLRDLAAIAPQPVGIFHEIGRAHV